MADRPVRIALDGMGGDLAPAATVLGALEALEVLPDAHILLVGDSELMDVPPHKRLSVVKTSEVIGMDEHPAQAVRAKPGASIPMAVRLVKEGAANAVVSAGNTGAVMAASLLILGRQRGVGRPAIATVIPTRGRPLVSLDMGATADCKAEHLLQFAHMGAAYAQVVLGVEEPRVGLLNIGEEAEKGSTLAQEAHALMVNEEALHFAGNVEGQHLLHGDLDVLVTDGFTGNVVLKVLEGAAESLFSQLRLELQADVRGRAAGLLARPALVRLKRRLDYEEHGGAPLLGVAGVSVIAHGRSSARAIARACAAAYRAAKGSLTERIARALDASASRTAQE